MQQYIGTLKQTVEHRSMIAICSL